LPVCYGLILTTFPNCDGHGYSPDPFCTACLGWWYAPIGTSGTYGAYGGIVSPILLVFNGMTLGGMVASIHIACLCLCHCGGSKPVPRAVWAIWVPLFMTIFFLIGYYAFGTALVVLARHFLPRRAPAQDSSNELSIGGTLSETATSSLMSNQATPEVHFVPNESFTFEAEASIDKQPSGAPIEPVPMGLPVQTEPQVPIGIPVPMAAQPVPNTPVHVPVVLPPMAPNLAPNVPVAVHVPMAPASVQTFSMAVHVTMAQHDHMAPTVPVAPNGPEAVSCTVSPLQCPPEGRPAPKASCADSWGLD